MKVYKDDSDEFDPEYLAYLGTLTSEVGTGRYRVTRNPGPDGELVRFEFWTDGGFYFNFNAPEWMNPPQNID